MFRIIFAATALALLAGCATYTTPGGSVSLESIDDTSIREAYSRQPAAAFPARIAVIRVQDSGYVNRTHRGHNLGRFSVITTRDIESDEAVETMAGLPMVAGVAPLTRILLPSAASSIRDLRKPAAQVKADMLLVYSVDTVFTIGGKSFGPLTAISLGLIPNKEAHVSATVSGVLVDVRTGYIYGVAEATAIQHQRHNLWATTMVTEEARLTAETQAFDDFISEFSTTWTGVLNTHLGRAAQQPAPPSGGWYEVPFSSKTNEVYP